MAKDWEQIAEELKKAGGSSGESRNLVDATAPHLKRAEDNIKESSKKFSEALKTDGFSAAAKTSLDGFDKAWKNTLSAGIAGLKKAADVGLSIATDFQNTFNAAKSSSMNSFLNNFSTSLTKMIPNEKMRGLMDSFLSGLFAAMEVRYQDGLKYRETRMQAEVQLGFGQEAATKFAKTTSSLFGVLGRDEAAQWGKAFAKEGITDTGEFKEMVGIGKAIGAGPEQAAKMLKEYQITTGKMTGASSVLTENFRKLQAAAKDSSLSVSQMSDWVTKAATNARFLNVDIGKVGNMMANLAKDTGKFSKFGVDLRQAGIGEKVLGELASGGKAINDAMHVYYGSKGGTENISAGKAWAKSMFGEEAGGGIQKTAGGGFDIAGKSTEDLLKGNNMMVNRLEMMKKVMEDASAGASDDSEALMLQMKAAKDVFGMSEDTAKVLALQGKDDIKKLADNPELANKFKDTNTILGEMRTMGAVNEQIQRLMADLNIKQLETLVRSPQMMAAIMSGDSETFNKMLADETGSYMETLAAIQKEVGGFIKGTVGNSLGALHGYISATHDKAKMGIFNVEKKASGGPVKGGELYQVNEEPGKPEFLIPGSDGSIKPFDSMMAAAGGGGGKTTVININGPNHGVDPNMIAEGLAKLIESKS